MSLQNLISADYEAFQHFAGDKQIVLLHPESRLRSMLVAYFLGSGEKPVYYYAMGPNDVTLRTFLDSFAHDIAVQQPTFGRNLLQNWGGKRTVDLAHIAEDFAEDLYELSVEPYMLIIDEFDATNEADDIQSFWEQVVHLLPDHCQLVINGRTMPRLPWVSLIASNKCVLLKDTDIIRDDFYQREVYENPEIDLLTQGFGPGYVQHEHGEVGEWEGHLPRLLFFFVLDRPVVTRAEICAIFWPDLNLDQAVNVFHVTKRRLHKALGFDALVHQDGYYQINPAIRINYDVERFTAALVKARRAESNEEALPLWQDAVDAYGGRFLQGHTESWILNRRQDFLIGYLEAMQAIASTRLAEGRPEQALALLTRAANENELYEPIHRDIMQLYADLGRRSEVAGHYQKLMGILDNEKRKPESETIELYENLMAG